VNNGVIICFLTVCLCATVLAAPPPKIPGEDITATVDALSKLRDSSLTTAPPTSPLSLSWLEIAMKTWDAPALSQQIDEDSKMIPVGKGGIFIPRLSDPALEPTIQINDANGKLFGWGETGKKYAAEPGDYSIVLGSGSIKQRIVKKITIVEGKIIPILPDWCGLSVDVVDENNKPFRGVYEMARLDTFEAYSRSYGRDITLGERVKTWILKPGLYKLFSAGGSYNSLTNFITVRLIPGEFVRVVVIENPNDNSLKILGGGVINVSSPSSQVSSHWKHSLDIGGVLQLDATNDKINQLNSKKHTIITFLTLFDLNYKKGSTDWETNIFWKEGYDFTDFSLSDIGNSVNADDFRITSLAVWRVILPWLGPYCRTEFRTRLLPLYSRFENTELNHFFIVLNPDSSVQEIDSTSKSKIMQPIFSHITADAGVGTNIDMVTLDNCDAKLRVGLGYSQMTLRNQKDERDSSYINYNKTDSAFSNELKEALKRNYILLQRSKNFTSRSFGPEFGLALNLRAGSWGVARGDFRMRTPVDHLDHPDWDINTTVSWTLTRSITLDYLFLYTLRQPTKEEGRVNQSSHSLFLRFSLGSR
jgi:hypothetical protein